MKFVLMWTSDQQAQDNDVSSTLIWHKAKMTFDTQDEW